MGIFRKNCPINYLLAQMKENRPNYNTAIAMPCHVSCWNIFFSFIQSIMPLIQNKKLCFGLSTNQFSNSLLVFSTWSLANCKQRVMLFLESSDFRLPVLPCKPLLLSVFLFMMHLYSASEREDFRYLEVTVFDVLVSEIEMHSPIIHFHWRVS